MSEQLNKLKNEFSSQLQKRESDCLEEINEIKDLSISINHNYDTSNHTSNQVRDVGEELAKRKNLSYTTNEEQVVFYSFRMKKRNVTLCYRKPLNSNIANIGWSIQCQVDENDERGKIISFNRAIDEKFSIAYTGIVVNHSPYNVLGRDEMKNTLDRLIDNVSLSKKLSFYVKFSNETIICMLKDIARDMKAGLFITPFDLGLKDLEKTKSKKNAKKKKK